MANSQHRADDDADRLARLERDWSFLSGIGEASKDDAKWIEQLREFTKPLPETEPSRNPYQQAMAARSLRLLDSCDAALRAEKEEAAHYADMVRKLDQTVAEKDAALREAREELERLRTIEEAARAYTAPMVEALHAAIAAYDLARPRPATPSPVPPNAYRDMQRAVFTKWINSRKERLSMPTPSPGATDDGQSEATHVLYKTGDLDAPDVIKDHNGEVVLGLCKVCGKAEVELDEPCVAADSGTTAAPDYLKSAAEMQRDVSRAFMERKLGGGAKASAEDVERARKIAAEVFICTRDADTRENFALAFAAALSARGARGRTVIGEPAAPADNIDRSLFAIHYELTWQEARQALIALRAEGERAGIERAIQAIELEAKHWPAVDDVQWPMEALVRVVRALLPPAAPETKP